LIPGIRVIKYATAIRLGTASTEAILRRFTRNASHPTYTAMLEVGRAQKTIRLEVLGDPGPLVVVDEDLALPERRPVLEDPHPPAVVSPSSSKEGWLMVERYPPARHGAAVSSGSRRPTKR
jgi:hypothetical protein